jgi:hypothetical protein
MESLDARPAANGNRFEGPATSGHGSPDEQRVTPEFALAPPSVSLPKGGGAIRGIDEKFAVNPATGTGSISVPIAATSGRQGFGPDLALSYDSGFGNGAFGLGWRLSLPRSGPQRYARLALSRQSC